VATLANYRTGTHGDEDAAQDEDDSNEEHNNVLQAKRGAAKNWRNRRAKEGDQDDNDADGERNPTVGRIQGGSSGACIRLAASGGRSSHYTWQGAAWLAAIWQVRRSPGDSSMGLKERVTEDI
jgi:hypothetical protein